MSSAAQIRSTAQNPGESPPIGTSLQSGAWLGSRVGSTGSQFAEWIARYPAWWAAVVALVWLLARAWYATRPLWFDELFTFYIARLPRLDGFFQALPADGNPPLYHLLARASMHLFGETELALRLPAMFGFVGAALAVYVYVRRRRGPVFGVFGMLFLLCGPMAAYGSEARPYSLMLGFTGLALMSWQAAAAREARRALPLIGVAIGIGGAIASHHYGAVHVGICLLFGEGVRILQRRRLDAPLYCAAAAGLSPLAVTLPLAAAAHRVMLAYIKQSPVFWAKPDLGMVLSFGEMLAIWVPAAFLVLWWSTRDAFLRPGAPNNRAAEGVPAHEAAAAIGLALMVPLMIGLTALTTHYYMDRYAIGSAMGIAILAGLVAPALGRSSSHAAAVASLCILLMVTAIGIRPLASAALHGTAWRRAASARPASLLRKAPGEDPIVIASALEYAQDWRYAPPQLRQRLHYLADVPYAVRQPDFLPEVSLVSDQAFLPCKADSYRQFVAAHRRFFVYTVGTPRLEWTVPRLRAASWSLRVVGREGDLTLYRADAPR